MASLIIDFNEYNYEINYPKSLSTVISVPFRSYQYSKTKFPNKLCDMSDYSG